MRRHVAQPLDTGGPVGRVGLAGTDVDLTGDGLVDDGLLLLLQQRTQLLLGADVAPDAPVGVVEEADDGGLFGEGGIGTLSALNFSLVKWLGNRRFVVESIDPTSRRNRTHYIAA